MPMLRRVVGFAAALGAAPFVHGAVLAGSGSHAVVGSLMRREQKEASADFAELNPPEANRRYSSIWDNNAIGTGHARSMLGSPQAWSAAANNMDQWMVIDAGALNAVKGVYFQARNPGSCCGNQIVTKVHFEYSKDCVTYTPVQGNSVFNTNVVANSPNSFLVNWEPVRITKCVKIWVDGWANHISMRTGLFARNPRAEDETKQEFMAQNPSEASRSYSSIWDNNAIGTGHATSMLDSPQGWSAIANNANQWMIVTLSSMRNVNGVYFQARNKNTQWGNQVVTGVSFETSDDCLTYSAVENGQVFQTGVKAFDENKQLVQWQEDRVAKCVKILVRTWSHHISMRVGLSVWENPTMRGFYAMAANMSAAHSTSVAEGPFDFYGDGTPTHVN